MNEKSNKINCYKRSVNVTRHDSKNSKQTRVIHEEKHEVIRLLGLAVLPVATLGTAIAFIIVVTMTVATMTVAIAVITIASFTVATIASAVSTFAVTPGHGEVGSSSEERPAMKGTITSS